MYANDGMCVTEVGLLLASSSFLSPLAPFARGARLFAIAFLPRELYTGRCDSLRSLADAT